MGIIDTLRQRFDAIVNALSGLGGSSDKGTVADVVERVPLSPRKCAVLYEQTGISQLIIDIIPTDALRGGFESPFEDDRDTSDIDALILQAAISARWGGGAAVLVRTGAMEWGEPLAPGEKVLGFTLLEREDFEASAWEVEDTSDRLGEPLKYNVHPAFSSTAMLTKTDVHWSRVIYFDGAWVTRQTRNRNSGFGNSIYEATYQAIQHVDQHAAAGATLVQELQSAVYKIAGLLGYEASGNDDLLVERIKLIAKGRSILNATILDAGDEYETRNASVSGFRELGDAAREMLAAVARIPMVRLFGIAPGGLSSDGESWKASYNLNLAGYQATLTSPIGRVYRAKHQDLSKTWTPKWLPLDVPSGKELAETRLIDAQHDTVRIADNVLSSDEVREQRFGGAEYSPQIVSVKGKLEQPLTPDEPDVPEDPPAVT